MALPPHEIEAWALRIIDRVASRQAVEDCRVELKADWIDPAGMARRIAALCNASGGADVLVIVGLDEDRGIMGVPATDSASQWSAVAACFDGPVPRETMVAVRANDTRSVMAILLESGRRPYVVRNAVFGRPGGGAVSLEVPWREGTGVRSARHEDLIRMLVAQRPKPTLDLVEGRLVIFEPGSVPPQRPDFRSWWLELRVYVIPAGEGETVIPNYLCSASWALRTISADVRYVCFKPYQRDNPNPPVFPVPHHLRCTDSEAMISAPGMLVINAGLVAVPNEYYPEPHEPAEVTVTIRAAGAAEANVIHTLMEPTTAINKEFKRWRCRPHGIDLAD